MGGPGLARMARGIHGLLKVSPVPAMPDPSTPGRRPPLKRPYARFGGGLRLSTTPYDTPRRKGLVLGVYGLPFIIGYLKVPSGPTHLGGQTLNLY
jgi:hypothetical protein